MSKRKKQENSKRGKRQRTTEKLQSQLADAIDKGDLEGFKEIVNGLGVEKDEREELLNCRFDRDFTLLHIAAEHNQVPIINWLLSEKEGEGRSLGFCKALAKDRDGRTALHVAASKGHIEAFHAIVNGCRVDNGERQEMLNAVDSNDYTILHIGSLHGHTSLISWILSEEGGRAAGFDSVLSRTKFGDTALHIAAQNVDLECFLAIVDGLRVDNGERQEMLNAVDDRGMTILHKAALRGREEFISWILSDEGGRAVGFNSVLSRTKDGKTALHISIEYASLESFLVVVDGLRVDNGERQEMLNAVDNEGRTVLHVAAKRSREELIKWILSEEGGRAAGFDSVLAKTTDDKRTALHLAAQFSFSDTLETLLSHCSNEERMNLFLAVDKHGWTALHHASRFKRVEVISHLLSYPECGLIVNMKDNRGMTALHRAIIGGIDEESRSEWQWRFCPDGETVRALLGLNGNSSSSSSSTTTKAWIDPNIGLGLL